MIDPLSLLRAFAAFAGVGLEVVQQFAEANPTLIEPGDADAPEPAPDDLIDPDVRRRIEEGEV